jgi:hypothetical protein
MALRWAAARMLAVQAQFRRVKGYRQLPHLQLHSRRQLLTSLVWLDLRQVISA